MNSNARLFKVAFPLTLSFSVLAACGPAPTTSTPSPSATSTPAPVATPTPAETAAATPTPAATPNPSETASATPTPAATATATATPSNPLASATSDISVIERTTFNGKVFDDTTAPIDGVTVTAKSLNSSLPYEATSTTAGGAYAFNNAPAGVQIEITVTKPGFTTRRRVEVLKSNKDGNPDANKYDFGAGAGSNGTLANAISDKPEVIAVTPGRNAAGVSPSTSIVMKFSEPMDRNTVLDSFEVRTFTTEKLSVDTSGNAATVVGVTDINTNLSNGTRIWDKSAFNASWNSDDSEVTFTFKEERALPSDKDTDKVPDYVVTFNKGGFTIAAPLPVVNNSLKDKAGISRNSDYFKLTEGSFEQAYKFSITTDTTKPRVDNITAQTAENSGVNSDGDVIRVRYSERMIHYTLGRTIAGGMGGSATQAPAAVSTTSGEAAAANYKVTVVRAGVPMLSQASWAALGGRAVFDTNDPTHKTVVLLPGNQANVRTITAGPVGQDVSVTYVYTDGSSETINAGTVANNNLNGNGTAGALLYATIDPDTGLYGGAFTDVGVANNVLDPGDQYYLTLGANARRNDGVNGTATGKQIAYAVINPTGAFGSGFLNAPTGGYMIYPGSSAGGRPDLYRPGDNVTVMVDTTVLDPAGNSVDSAADDASANAS